MNLQQFQVIPEKKHKETYKVPNVNDKKDNKKAKL